MVFQKQKVLIIIFFISGTITNLTFSLIYYTKWLNKNAASWALISALLSTLSVYLHIQYVRGNWKIWPHRLLYMVMMGIFGMAISVISSVVYISLIVIKKQNIRDTGENFIHALIWSLCSIVWSVLHFIGSYKYKKSYTNCYTLPRYQPLKSTQ